MAVTACEIHKKQSSFNANESSHTVVYWISTDTDADPVDVYVQAQTFGSTPLPTQGDQHPQDLLAFALSVEIEHRKENNFRHWQAVVRYGQPEGKDTTNADPLLWEVQYGIDYKLVSRVVTRDAYGEPLLNTARDPIPDPPRLDFHVPILIATKNYASLDEIVALGYQFDKTRNDSLWFGALPGQAQFEGIRAGQLSTFNEVDYYPATISIAIDYQTKTDGKQYLDNVGWRAWKGDPQWISGAVVPDPDGLDYYQPETNWTVHAPGHTATHERIIADNGEPLTAPVHLTADGNQSTATDLPIFRIAYDILRPENYTSIGIGG